MPESLPTKRGFWYVVLGAVIAGLVVALVVAVASGFYSASTGKAALAGLLPAARSSVPESDVLAMPPPESVGGTVTQYLAELDPMEGYAGNGVREVGGETLPHSIFKDLGGCDLDGSIVYNLSKDWTELNLIVGLDDTSDLDAVAETKIFADGNPVFESDNLVHGESYSTAIQVAGVLSLRLKFSFLEGNMGQCSRAGLVVWGEPTLSR
ncbi:NPCBM/NEW2 domain-containing protein [Cryobacterium aureum]|uniref:NPCBM/NEW2 domain-containing protein n=1 Tax=Cryobacterium aureum TaxID=995037 RepID=UPI001374FDFF|nr:NPCBM/NEW2 domain-containing protein [Cryobacterium aureum]